MKTEKQIDEEIFPIKENESVNERFKITNALINGYNQWSPIERALGFKNPYELQSNLHGVHHLINAGDVEVVVRWLIKNNYEIIKRKV